MDIDKKMAREERIAIMMESGVTEEDAETYCDLVPTMYGSREWKQDTFTH